MPSRPVWRGHLRLALVSCPIALYTSHTERENLHFHFINPKTGNRIRMITQDAETGDELSRRDLVRGYEFEKDEYVLLDDEDFERARIESSSMLTVEKFVEAGTIDPVYFDTSYYVAPDGDAGLDVYVVLRDAIRDAGAVALSRLVLSRRERPVALMPMANGLVLHTLYEARDVVNSAEIFASVPGVKPEAEMVKLATQLIDRQAAPFAPGDMEDRYETRLREVIDAKLAGRRVTPVAAETRGNVVDLMAALKRSLGQVADAPAKKTAPKKPAAAPAPKAKPAPRKRA